MAEYLPGTPEQRATLKRYYRECDRIDAERARVDTERERIRASHRYVRFVRARRGHRMVIVPPVLPAYPEHLPYPVECYGMSCGAKNRKGSPCKLTNIYENGRCKFHGGLSTGPRTKGGKRRSAKNGLRPKRKRTP